MTIDGNSAEHHTGANHTMAIDNNDRARSRATAGRARRFAPLAVLLGGLGLGYLFGLHEFLSFEALVDHRDMLKAYVMDNLVLSSIVFLLVYTAATAFAFPAASLLTILGGFVFGWFLAGTLTAFAATIGATIIFLAARTALGDFLQKLAGPGVSKLAHSFEENAFGFLLVLRLAPIFPFFVINIAPALFNVSLRTYVAATFIGILPGTYAYAYLGQGLDSVVLSAKEAGRDVSISDLVTTELTIAFIALAAVAAIPFVIRKFRTGRQA